MNKSWVFYLEDMLDPVHMCADGLHAIFLY